MPTGKPIPEDVRRAMIADYLAGATLKEAASKFGLSLATCHHALIRQGISRRPLSTARRIYSLDETYFEAIDTEEKAYWLGFIAADGKVSDGESRHQDTAITLARTDREHLVHLARCLKTNRPVTDIDAPPLRPGKPVRPHSRLTITSAKVLTDLASHGIEPRKSLTARPWSGPPALVASYWRGAFDGDGSISSGVCTNRINGKVYMNLVWSVEFCGSLAMVEAFAHHVETHVGHCKSVEPISTIHRVRYSGVGLPQEVVRLLYTGTQPVLTRKLLLAQELLAVRPARRTRKRIR